MQLPAFPFLFKKIAPKQTSKKPNPTHRVTVQVTAQSNHTLTNSELKRQVFNAAQKALLLTPAQIKGIVDYTYYNLSYVYLTEH